MQKNILIITQTVDEQDSNLGFFCGWITEFSKQLEHVYVIANKVGNYNLPDNVTVLSLGKEKGAGRIKKMFTFWKYLIKYIPKSRAVFVHMCPEYLIFGAWKARFFGKKVGLWYLHKSLTWKLKLAVFLSNKVFTAHSDGLPIKSSKVLVTGHGIDMSVFEKIQNKSRTFQQSIKPNWKDFSSTPSSPQQAEGYLGKVRDKLENGELDLLTVGRVSDSKNLLILAKSVMILQQKMQQRVRLEIVGEPYLKEDEKYLEDLKKYIKDNNAEDLIKFIGKVSHDKVADYHSRADLFLNAGKTGGVDKAVLEAMASGVPVITSNSAFKNILPENCLFQDGNSDELVQKILNYKNINTAELRDIVVKNHSLKNTIKTILNKLQI
ncbi:MAG: hypothetical protein A2469_00250 [Candidatus Magasanikbacteria bacterium RIFOXYC2_FULL_40_16]|uniref:Glycosyl transferase family 1 domain-containing protein n=3 Tax=Candidatus Magasanikiibacteriota TaxID=1752731 RepID=A0A1F6NJI1_9BACT|nr:MAG: hypothetical protein A2224_03485 [Candidatus Magasanikbacteria bacterium RIFOXYA2_FULL_40_20]OGH83834.1 MAG: hypothetical protein A2373_00315 [Candidatus Magasanikbacteria bacterium RIFOXYB1_FULL_40_15]OGH86510.1 MAG: hypothetical protein A2301_01395 [Candidatus Magasanikbacteria bacterium RIFOXYB2_FULL_40_13]OGH87734.1 MAG: hypothetical protein A2206_01565 [Candidatus Magasanikbacteria bacterium RIFOXYA1_FULL_40_8]OGH90282.1 MAG: hypothetical protein A2469_00250 [Candidatus Magasanikba